MDTIKKNKPMKKRTIFLTTMLLSAFCFLLSANKIQAQITVIDSGDCGANGNNLAWVLYSDSTLTIYGSGDMMDYPTWYSYRKAITTAIIGDSVTSIGDDAFFGCSSLTSITIPNSVKSIGNGAFSTCTNLTSITIPDSVISIGISAFFYCYGLVSVSIPNSVMNIGNRAFGRCKNLTSIDVGSENSTYASDSGILFNKDKTILIYCPTGRTGGYVIPNSVISISDYAFEECGKLAYVTFPNSITRIGNSAFWGCGSLTSIIIPDSVTNIGNSTFACCSGLTSIILPNNITSIEGGTFAYCRSLDSIIIPNSVTNIGHSAFADCKSLKAITIHAIMPPILSYNVFFGVDKSIPVYIPCLTYNSYHNASEWNDFTNFIIHGSSKTSYTVATCYVPYTDSNFTTPIYSSGIYYTALVNSENCDSIICLNLLVNITNYSATICQGETYTDTYFTNLTQSGIYYDTLQNVNGYCDNIVCLTLTVIDISIPTNVIITQSTNSFIITWQGNGAPFHLYRNNILLTLLGSTYYTDNNLKDGATYCYKIKAINGKCESDFSDTVCQTYNHTGIEQLQIMNSGLRIYPNPTNSRLNIENGQFKIENIEIYDIYGRNIVNCQLSMDNSIDISHLTAGMYFIKIKTEQGTVIQKIIKNQ